MKPQTIASIKRHRTAKMAKVATRALYLQRRGRSAEMAAFIANEMVALGGVYVKFLQGVLLQSEFFKQWDNPNRYNIFENLDTEMIDLPTLLQKELPKSKLAQIAQVQPQPFAAGSFGQVYFGALRDGSPIIIKALRPLVRETLQYDLKLINVFAKKFFIKLFESNVDINASNALDEFKHSTLNETDYVSEANFAAEYHEAYKSHPTLFIPKTYLELCTPNIIVQEYVGGISAAQLIKLKEQGIEPLNYVWEHLGSNLDEQLTSLGIEFIKGIFTLPRIQGDPHPGNIKLLENNRVGIVDFGIIAPAPQDSPAFFALMEEYAKLYEGNLDIEELFGKFLRFFASDLYRAFRRLHDMSSHSSEDLTKTIGKIAKKAFAGHMNHTNADKLMHDDSILSIINQVVNRQNRFGIVLTVHSSEILRAAQTYITLVETLDRGPKVLPVVFRRGVDEVKTLKPELSVEKPVHMSVTKAVDTVTRWLGRVAERDPQLFQKFMKQIRGGSAEPVEEAVEKVKDKETLNV
ncbi:MAG TPA: AarF/ABC1/UbiB kinase family protein [Candidatus Saccharimonadales bacterium]|nr:AarF/ABC1/UbiB kinase family protein [Candidatus Saccharimonadales bacterium]